MSSVECLREFVNERLSAAAEEIFRVFKQTIVEYEEEIDRQRRLLDICWKPEIKLYKIDQFQLNVCKEEEEVLTDQQLCNQERNSSLDQEDPEPSQIKEEQEELCTSHAQVYTNQLQLHVCKEEEEVLTDQQLCNQERNSILDQEDPDPPQIKEEQEELCTTQEGEQLVLKQETDTFMLTPTHVESDRSEPETNCDDQLLCNSLHIAESQDQKGDNHGDSRSSRDVEPKPKKRHHKSSHSGKKPFKCDKCRKVFTRKTTLCRHLGRHICEKPRSCQTCGKSFRFPCELKRHLMSHTGERPYSCSHCGRGFIKTSELNIHIRTHTGEKPYSCNTCGEKFCRKSELNTHIRIHTGERPHSCKTCGKDFRFGSELKVHMRIHTGERPYHCNTCGRTFNYSSALKKHMKIHTDENAHR